MSSSFWYGTTADLTFMATFMQKIDHLWHGLTKSLILRYDGFNYSVCWNLPVVVATFHWFCTYSLLSKPFAAQQNFPLM